MPQGAAFYHCRAGVGAGAEDRRTLVLSGVAGWVGGAMSMVRQLPGTLAIPPTRLALLQKRISQRIWEHLRTGVEFKLIPALLACLLSLLQACGEYISVASQVGAPARLAGLPAQGRPCCCSGGPLRIVPVPVCLFEAPPKAQTRVRSARCGCCCACCARAHVPAPAASRRGTQRKQTSRRKQQSRSRALRPRQVIPGRAATGCCRACASAAQALLVGAPILAVHF